MASQLDWYQAALSVAERLPKNPSIELIRARFKEMESSMLEARLVVGKQREQMIGLLQVHGVSLGRNRYEPQQHWFAASEITKFIYSSLRDRAYGARDVNMLANINQVYLERLHELKKGFALHIAKDTSGALARAIEWSFSEAELMQWKSIEALASLGPVEVKRRRYRESQ